MLCSFPAKSLIVSNHLPSSDCWATSYLKVLEKNSESHFRNNIIGQYKIYINNRLDFKIINTVPNNVDAEVSLYPHFSKFNW